MRQRARVVSNRFNAPTASDAAGILRRQPPAVSSSVKSGPIPGGFVAKLRVSPPRAPASTRDTRRRP
ncbi:hypothetical protein CFB52_023105 [Burkholderia sp. AU18528]|nr:hypothetical protein CFB52_023105 [Burkholderia sp. AU18528]RQV85049.1 hypothetical protein DF160_08335 [Burkholderia anthina]RQX81645.1 hypothetical protein DF034_18430 [Burkholderia anthina]